MQAEKENDNNDTKEEEVERSCNYLEIKVSQYHASTHDFLFYLKTCLIQIPDLKKFY